MQINNLPQSQINEPKPSASAAVANPPPQPKQAPQAKPPAPKPASSTVAAPAKKEVVAAAASTAGTKTEITDVKATGDTNAEGDPTFTMKVNGQEIQATQSQILALAQKAKGAESAMKKSAEIEKLASDFLDNFDQDAYGLMVKRHGKEKADQMVIAMTRRLIEEDKKDPKDRELERIKAENDEFKAAQERTKKEGEAAERQAKQVQLYKTILTDIDTALNETHLPKDKLTLTRVLNYLGAGKKANGTSWTVREAVKAVEVEEMSHASYYGKRYVEGKLPSEIFRSMFGDDALKKLNKENINLLKNADKIAKNSEPRLETNGGAPVTPRRTLSKNRGSDGMSEREYRRTHGSLGGI